MRRKVWNYSISLPEIYNRVNLINSNCSKEWNTFSERIDYVGIRTKNEKIKL